MISENKTLLFISDSPEQFSSAAATLRHEGYRILFEKEANQALKTAKAKTPDMIVSELAVPNIDGLELCSRVRGENNLGATPVLLVGDLSKQSDIVADGFRCGASDYLQRPFGDADLIETLHGIKTLGHGTPNAIIFDSIVRNVSDVSFVVDEAGTILVASESSQGSLGYHPSELIARSIFDLIHHADGNEMRAYLDSIYWELGKTEPIDYRIKQGDGTWQLMEASGRIVNDLRIGLLIVLTSRESREKNASYEGAIKNDILRNALFENAGIGIAIFSPSGRLVRTNPALLRMLDHDENELRDMLLAELVFPRDPENDKAALVEITSGRRQHYKFDNGYMNPHGERVWGALTLVTIAEKDADDAFLIGIFEEPSVQPLGGSPKRRVESPLQNGDDLVWSGGHEWKIDRGLISEN